MWTRKDLKDKAKLSFKKNYWKCVLVGFLIALLTGGFAAGANGGFGGLRFNFTKPISMPSFSFPVINMPEIDFDDSDDEEERYYPDDDDEDTTEESKADDGNTTEVAKTDTFSYNGNDYKVKMDDQRIIVTNEKGEEVVNIDGNKGSISVNSYDDLGKIISSDDENFIVENEDGNVDINLGDIDPMSWLPGLIIATVIGVAAIIGVIIIISLIVSFIIFVISFAIDVFFINPVEVGGCRFFRRNLEEPANISNITYGYDKNYKNVVKVMFFRDLYIYLWSLLFIIPGIIKSYEYRMIPYLLSENPEMTKEEAFAESKRLMMGQKWETFVLDLSFIGWHILGGFTFGLLNIFYVAPYQLATNAALYETLKYGMVTVEPAAEPVYEDEPEMTPEQAYEQDVETEE